MQNNIRDRLVELLKDTLHEWECDIQPETVSQIADHLIENEVVPVVKCKDCKYSRDKNKEEKRYLCEGVLICTNCEATEDGWCAKYLDDYCSYGERRI